MQKFRQTPFFFMAPFLVIFILLAIVFAFLNPLICIVFIIVIIIQVPVLWIMATSSYTTQYLDRAAKRKEQYEADGDAKAWLAKEEEEASSLGYKYWSKTGRMHSALNRARALVALGRLKEAQVLLDTVDTERIDTKEFQNYSDMLAYIKGEKKLDGITTETVTEAAPAEITVKPETVTQQEDDEEEEDDDEKVFYQKQEVTDEEDTEEGW